LNAPRVGLIGARRVRQGLGPFVAKFLTELGAEIPAFLGTSASSVQAATTDLEQHGVTGATGYTNLGDMLARESLDAIAILSPAETHEGHLQAALNAGLHVLCEKPLIWSGADLAGRTRTLVEGFAARGLLLAENCQWPEVLPTFAKLYPDAADEPLKSFGMLLSPASQGAQMIGDALPHPLSMLQALEPSPEAELLDPRVSNRDPAARELVLEFLYRTPRADVEVRIELIRGETLPRRAGVTINGRTAERRIRLQDYSLFLAAGTRELPLEDPLLCRLRRFLVDLDQARHGHLPPAFPIPQRARMLERLLETFRSPETPETSP